MRITCKYQAIVTMTILLLSSCSKDESLPKPDNKVKINFSLDSGWEKSAMGRSLSSSSNAGLEQDDIVVFGAMTDRNSYLGTSHHFNWMYKARIEHRASNWQYTTSPGDYYFDYWKPNGLHSFFAFTPYDAIYNDNVEVNDVILAPNAIGTKVNPSLTNFSIPTNSIKNGYDLMYASAMNIEGNEYPTGGLQGSDFPENGKIVLTFKHALSQVSFDIKLHENLAAYLETDNEDFIEVRRISFTNMKNSGNFSFYNDGTAHWVSLSGNTDVTWGGNGEGIFQNAQWSSTLGTTKTVSAIPHIADGETYIATLMPQKLAKDAAIILEYYRHSRLEDESQGIFTNTYLLKDVASIAVDEFGNKMLEQGKNYKFRITIDNGNEVKFSVTLSPWVVKEATLPI